MVAARTRRVAKAMARLESILAIGGTTGVGASPADQCDPWGLAIRLVID